MICKKIDKKENIINAAFELFKIQGYDETKIEDITNKANISKGSFYTYFKSKEEVLYDILIGICQYEKEVIDNIEISDDPMVQMENFIIARFEMITKIMKNVHIKNTNLAIKNSTIKQFQAEMRNYFQNYIKNNIILKNSRSGEYDVDAIAKFINIAIESYLVNEIINNGYQDGMDSETYCNKKLMENRNTIREITKFIDNALKDNITQ